MPLKSTTRHIQIYAAVVDQDNDELIDSENTRTIRGLTSLITTYAALVQI